LKEANEEGFGAADDDPVVAEEKATEAGDQADSPKEQTAVGFGHGIPCCLRWL